MSYVGDIVLLLLISATPPQLGEHQHLPHTAADIRVEGKLHQGCAHAPACHLSVVVQAQADRSKLSASCSWQSSWQ